MPAECLEEKNFSRTYRRNFERTANDNGTEIHICLLALRKYRFIGSYYPRVCEHLYKSGGY